MTVSVAENREAHDLARGPVHPAWEIDCVDGRPPVHGFDHGARRARRPADRARRQTARRRRHRPAPGRRDWPLRPFRSNARRRSPHRPSAARGCRPAGPAPDRLRSARRRAATNPSPPLLPGPATTTILLPGGCREATRSATARPAFSIRSMPGTPPAIASRSASAISVAVRSSIMVAGRVARCEIERDQGATCALSAQLPPDRSARRAEAADRR